MEAAVRLRRPRLQQVSPAVCRRRGGSSLPPGAAAGSTKPIRQPLMMR